MKKRKVIVCFGIFLVIALALVLYFHNIMISPFEKLAESEDVFLQENESYFRKFNVTGDLVEVHCYLTLENRSTETQAVYLYAYLPKDKGRLVKDGTLSAINGDNQLISFEIPPKTSVAFEDVCFIGTFGGRAMKYDRLLPEVAIVDSEGIR